MRQEHGIANSDWSALRGAVGLLEHPGLAARLTSLIGAPIDEGLTRLPPSWHRELSRVSERVVSRSLDVAVSTLTLDKPGRSAPLSHRNLGVASKVVSV